MLIILIGLLLASFALTRLSTIGTRRSPLDTRRVNEFSKTKIQGARSLICYDFWYVVRYEILEEFVETFV